jgi:hypothetical protein
MNTGEAREEGAEQSQQQAYRHSSASLPNKIFQDLFIGTSEALQMKTP